MAFTTGEIGIGQALGVLGDAILSKFWDIIDVVTIKQLNLLTTLQASWMVIGGYLLVKGVNLVLLDYSYRTTRRTKDD
jgi:hypothetical protein